MSKQEDKVLVIEGVAVDSVVSMGRGAVRFWITPDGALSIDIFSEEGCSSALLNKEKASDVFKWIEENK